MRIKKLEVSGFKSFAERAKLTFGDGITGVVGPNGCGKSNVVDAVRWCMGEQSAKNLRGRGMQDVIFAGSTKRAAQNMAEVTLTFDNDGNVPPAYLNFSEIAVTRRLFRDGSSEYLINRSPVRLRDITDLFLGTGVGTKAYSIIEQGRIGFVVNAKPEERRTLIEEVAGITKFKLRKKAAERRMESTEQNLARVRDVVSELERQLTTLRRQAEKARAYRELRARLREGELHEATLRLLEQTTRKEVLGEELSKLGEALERSHADTHQNEEALKAGREALAQQREQLTTLQETSSAKEASLAALVRDVAHAEQQQTQLGEAERRAQLELEQAKERRMAAESELSALEAELETLRAATAGSDEQIAKEEATVRAAHEALEEADGALEALREQLMAQHRDAAQRQAELGAANRAERDCEAQLERNARERADLLPQQEALKERLAHWRAEEARLDSEAKSSEERRAELQAAIPALRDALAAAQSEAQRLMQQEQRRQSRLASLEQIVSRLEGYGDGVRRLWAKGKPALPGLVGLVAAVLEVPSQFERAVETVLGERLQYLLIESPDVVDAALGHLTQKGGGRAGFVPASLPARTYRPSEEAQKAQGVLGVASDLIGVSDGHAALGAALLGHVLLVEDWATAQREAQRFAGEAWLWVAPDGQAIDGFGIASGGTDSGAGLLATRREIRSLREKLEEEHEQLLAAEAERKQCAEALAQADEARRELEASGHKRELLRVRVVKDVENGAREEARLARRLEELGEMLAQQQDALKSLRSRAQELESAAASAQSGQEALGEELSEAEQIRSERREALAVAREAQTAVRVSVAAARERLGAATDTHARITQQIAAWGAQRERAEATLEHCKGEAAAIVDVLARVQSERDAASTSRDEALKILADARLAYDAAEAQLQAHEQALSGERATEDALKEQIIEARLGLERLEAARNQLLAQVLERHDVDLLAVAIDYHDRPPPSREAQKEHKELEQKIRAMGSINLTAIEECQALEERFSFLCAQRDDLDSALTSLKEAIARINRTSRERFVEAFEAVNKMFKEVYPRLFRGGEARLEMTQADDVLEAGVEIVASPPGKRLQNVNLMSGGEKALTATAVVFAIFLIKPSPFCILDEVDAPLDEANVGRFNDMLRDISKVSQFIVITHNKQTMLQMDRLYGITMEQPGMSKVVAVDLERQRATEAA